MQKDNGLLVPNFFYDMDDDIALYTLIPKLRRLATLPDVRPVCERVEKMLFSPIPQKSGTTEAQRPLAKPINIQKSAIPYPLQNLSQNTALGVKKLGIQFSKFKVSKYRSSITQSQEQMPDQKQTRITEMKENYDSSNYMANQSHKPTGSK